MTLPLNDLTDRELQVLRYTAQGMTAEQIATAIKRSASTVRSHQESARLKLGARNAPHMVALGYDTGYLPEVKQ